jgi:outer membrane protein insertion porin family
MRAFTTVVRRTAFAAAVMSLLPFLGIGSDIVGVSAAQAEVVSSIAVRGNQRIEAETVRSYLTIKPGKSFSNADVDESLKALYATGVFSDVQIDREGGGLVVRVTESPLINRINFEGNKRLTKEQLDSVVESRPRGFLSRGKVASDVQRLLEVYRRSGRFRAVIEPKVIQLPENRVDLVFEIDEGDKTPVSRISFTGNKAFSDGRLRDVVKTRETGLLGFLRTTDTYDADRLQADQELIRKYYLRNGYADFRIVSASADLDRENNVFFVNFTVDEGDLYTYGPVDVQSSLEGLDVGQLSRVVETRSGAPYNAEEIDKSIEAIVTEAARQGFAFAQVRPRAIRDYQGKTITLTYYVEEGARVYIERINIRGNIRTRDYVIRREFELSEGDAYNRAWVNRAERRLNRLGFFKSVKVTAEPGSSPDRVVMNVDVEEQSTGELGFGVGYSTAEGVIGDLSLVERNFLGRGQMVKASIQVGESQRGYSLSFTEPYFLGRRIQAGFDIYTTHYEDTYFRSYQEDSTGLTLRAGFPVTDSFTFGVSYSIYQQDVMLARSQVDGRYNDGGEASLAYKQYLNPSNPFNPCPSANSCHRTALTSMPSVNVVYNTVDNIQFPRSGVYAKFQTDFAGLGGDTNFLRFTGEARYYRELYPDWNVIGMLKGKAGYITPTQGSLGIINNFFLGGETIRGFAPSGIGARDITRVLAGKQPNYRIDESLGGTTYVAGTAEAMMPFPFTPEEFGLYVAAFADAGTLYGVDDSVKKLVGDCPNGRTYKPTAKNPLGCGPQVGPFTIADDSAIRSSVGVGIVWRSPFGPLRADFGFALTKGKGDQTQVFRFSGGTQF